MMRQGVGTESARRIIDYFMSIQEKNGSVVTQIAKERID
jgi:myosin heavy subunit